MGGECGIDTDCMMLGIPQTSANRDALRRDISDYVLDRMEAPWLHPLLVVCEELRVEDLENYRCSGGVPLAVDLERSAETESDNVKEGKHEQQVTTSRPQLRRMHPQLRMQAWRWWRLRKLVWRVKR